MNNAEVDGCDLSMIHIALRQPATAEGKLNNTERDDKSIFLKLLCEH